MTEQPFSVYQSFFLVGIKGVAMTSLAQILVDLGKTVIGCDVTDEFVTQPRLDALNIECLAGFEHHIPETVDCVVYTAAHKGAKNPLVQQAAKLGIPTYSQAEALGHMYNTKKGIAVCGVGGKSTTSAMLTWILSKLDLHPSYSVGVGEIVNLPRTGVWEQDSEYFVAEADEYVTNPEEVKHGAQPTPRFSYLKPFCTICTNLEYDHPDVYKNFAETKKAYINFFNQIKPGGVLILNEKDVAEVTTYSASEVRTFGAVGNCDYLYDYDEAGSKDGVTKATLIANNTRYDLTLHVPGRYNVENAVAALAACDSLGIDLEKSIEALSSFASTKRRYERIENSLDLMIFDDYAHHPSEIEAVIRATKNWFPHKEIFVAFQPHTYSRTKALLSDFAAALSLAPNLVLLDIFASARESVDESISSQLLADEITATGFTGTIPVIPDYQSLAQYIQELPHGSVVLTLGAGDIYKALENV